MKKYKGYWIHQFDGKWHVYDRPDAAPDRWVARCPNEDSAKTFVLIEREKQAA